MDGEMVQEELGRVRGGGMWVTDWSREKRKRGGMVSKRGVCIGSSLDRRKECPRGEKTGRVRMSARPVPPQAQKIRMLGKETTV